MLGFVSARMRWKAISNLEPRHSHKTLRDDLVLLSVTNISNICGTEYELTVDTIKIQLALRYKVGLALDGLSSTHKLDITSIVPYYID
jgi:hypothetical protein